MRGRPSPPAVPDSALGCYDHPLLQASLPRVARGRPGRRLGGETARRRAWQDHRVLPAGSSVLGRGTGRQAGREDPSSCLSGFWSLGSLPAWACGHRSRREQAESFKHEEERFHTQWEHS